MCLSQSVWPSQAELAAFASDDDSDEAMATIAAAVRRMQDALDEISGATAYVLHHQAMSYAELLDSVRDNHSAATERACQKARAVLSLFLYVEARIKQARVHTAGGFES